MTGTSDDTGPRRDRELTIALVAAVAENGVIGDEGSIPWHYPADLAHFKETTMGHPVIVGRRTYESIAERLGGPLPGRTNVVLTRTGVEPGVPTDGEPVETGDGRHGTRAVLAGSVDEAIETAADADGIAYVAGGATVYEQFLPVADRMILTEIPEAPTGETHFPAWDRDAWTVVDRRERDELSFVTYERRED